MSFAIALQEYGMPSLISEMPLCGNCFRYFAAFHQKWSSWRPKWIMHLNKLWKLSKQSSWNFSETNVHTNQKYLSQKAFISSSWKVFRFFEEAFPFAAKLPHKYNSGKSIAQFSKIFQLQEASWALMRLHQNDHFKTAKFKESCMADSNMSPCILYSSHITHAQRLWNHIEGLFALDLIILAAVTYLVKLSEGNQLTVGYTSLTQYL